MKVCEIQMIIFILHKSMAINCIFFLVLFLVTHVRQHSFNFKKNANIWWNAFIHLDSIEHVILQPERMRNHARETAKSIKVRKTSNNQRWYHIWIWKFELKLVPCFLSIFFFSLFRSSHPGYCSIRYCNLGTECLASISNRLNWHHWMIVMFNVKCIIK